MFHKKNLHLVVAIIVALLLSACTAGMAPIKQLAPKSNTRTVSGVTFEVTACDLFKQTRKIVCHGVVTSNYRDRKVGWERSYTKIQDDTGQSYYAIGGYGLDPTTGRNSSDLVADQPYNVTFIVDNIDSRATSVRAFTFGAQSFKPGSRNPPLTLSGFRVNVIEEAPATSTEHGKIPTVNLTSTSSNTAMQPLIKQQPLSKELTVQSTKILEKPTSDTHTYAGSIGGEWREIIFGKDMGTARIEQDNINLKIWNFEVPPKFTEGHINEAGVIHATSWGITGTIAEEGKKILWSNGVVWLRN